MNRFINKDFPQIEIDLTYMGIDQKGHYYRNVERWKPVNIDESIIVLYNSLIYHWPDRDETETSIENIRVEVDGFPLKISELEYETIYKNIEQSIKILNLNY